MFKKNLRKIVCVNKIIIFIINNNIQCIILVWLLKLCFFLINLLGFI